MNIKEESQKRLEALPHYFNYLEEHFSFFASENTKSSFEALLYKTPVSFEEFYEVYEDMDGDIYKNHE